MTNTDNNTIDANDVAEKVKIATKVEQIIRENMFSTLDELKELITKELNINKEDIELKYDQNKKVIISIGDSIDAILTSITIA